MNIDLKSYYEYRKKNPTEKSEYIFKNLFNGSKLKTKILAKQLISDAKSLQTETTVRLASVFAADTNRL